ncbi:sugar transferase [Pararhodobacter sp.]|uniref:sugar transferase n=1 Tax=Pararhodobacter sp. TaxID=2127056 RepID=UPI002FDD9CD0
MRIFTFPGENVQIVQPLTTQYYQHPTRSRLSRASKLVLDRLMALFAIAFFAPFFLTVAVLILIFDGSPVVYSQLRVGRGGRLFRCHKFRTMVKNADRALHDLLEADPAARQEWDLTQKLTKDPRISCLGAFLRKTSLDELPQFWNVLKGDMSIVGPRPIVTSEIRHYGDRIGDYLSVRPGITGLWQVSGRSDTSYEQRVSLDCAYVAQQSTLFDMSIIVRTIGVVLLRKGAR